MIQILSSRRVAALLCLVTTALSANAQQGIQDPESIRKGILADPKVKSVDISPDRQTPSLIAFASTPGAYPKALASDLLSRYLGLRPGLDELRPVRTVGVPGGREVVEFHQYYMGIRVDRSRYTALVSNGNIRLLNGSFYQVPAGLSLSPRVSKEAALNAAKGTALAKKFAWEKLAEGMAREKNPAVRAAMAEELNEVTPKGELVLVQNFKKNGKAEVRLAYKFNIYAVEPLSRAWVYVDAADGSILLRDAIIKHVNTEPTSVATTVNTRYAGTRTIRTKRVSGVDPNNGLPLLASNPAEVYVPGSPTYVLADDTRGGGVETYDLNAVGGLPISLAPAYAQAKAFTDVDNNWTVNEHHRGGLNEVENDDIAWDAHWGASVVYDYWKEKQGRLSYDGNNAKIRSYVHSGVGYDNAFWNGSVMTYGDGSFPAPGGFRPLTSLDVCGHEIGHGVCSFTSDLVYEKESGAMNEGFSDIWAACTEYFAIKRVDASLANIYKPFHIGEQIAANPAQPLRRMDNPKAAGDPDTYGGTNWRNVNCSPSLANDNCGVHTNSGVLNKWFYLMTTGSGAGSGPDAAFAGQDDGMNDQGEKYTVEGLGFDLAERIAYLTELMLTSTATFAEARAVSISVAEDLSGNPCSNVVKSVADAWYAVGVGDAFVQPCIITYGFIFQPGRMVSEGTAGNGCSAETSYNVPVRVPAGGSATLTLSGTAANTTDYRIPATTLSNTTGQLATLNFTVFVKNDAEVERDETVVLTAAVTGTGSSPVNKTYTLTIVEDDVVPVLGNGTKTLLKETFTRADGFADPAGWREILEVPEDPNGTQAAKGKNQWGIFGNALGITGRDEITGTQLPNNIYNNNSISQTIAASPYLDARGLSRLQLKFNFQVQGEADPTTLDPDNFAALDYMSVVYSLDGTTWFEFNQLPFTRFAALTPTTGTVDATLPSFLANKQFYLGFRWVNDPLIGGPYSVSLDNVELTGAVRQIENELGHNSRETLNAGSEVYFYSVQDGQLVGRVKNSHTKAYGCTNMLVEKAGNGSFNLYEGSDGLHKVADKVVRVEAALIYKASNTVTIYFTEDQLLALEAATDMARTSLQVYHVKDAAYTRASQSNTAKYKPVYTPLPGVGGSFTFTFNDRVNGSFALGGVVSVIGLQKAPTVKEESDPAGWNVERIYPNPGSGDAQLVISAPADGRVRVDLINAAGQVVGAQSLNVIRGRNVVRLSTGRLTQGAYLVRTSADGGAVINTQNYQQR